MDFRRWESLAVLCVLNQRSGYRRDHMMGAMWTESDSAHGLHSMQRRWRHLAIIAR
jgi:hypothetical protein